MVKWDSNRMGFMSYVKIAKKCIVFFFELLPTYGLDIAYNQYHRQKIKARNKLENILKQGFSRFDFF